MCALVPINGLVPAHQADLLRHGEFLSVRKGKYLFRKGERDEVAYYLVAGTIELRTGDQLVKAISEDDDSARHALAQLQPRQMSALARTEVRIFKIDRGLLERYLTLEGTTDGSAMDEDEEEEEGDWMSAMLQSDLFSRIPPANIQQIFTHMESVSVNPGDVIVEQGTPGDYYYFVQNGRCEVTRRASSTAPDVRLAELGAGKGFGEEALVSNAMRNASITMLTEGRLMRLSKANFIELIKKPALSEVDYVTAEEMAADGAIWLDVRFPDEFKQSGIAGSVNLPLNVLRMQAQKLDDEKQYIAYCDTGKRSSAGAFLLTQAGLNVSFLAGGLAASPMAQRLQGTESEAPVATDKIAVPAGAVPEMPAAAVVSEDAARVQRALQEKVAKMAGQLSTAQGLLRQAAIFKRGAETKFRQTRTAFEERLRAAREAHEKDLVKAREAIAAARRFNSENQRLKKVLAEARSGSQDVASISKARDDMEEKLLTVQSELEAERARHEEENARAIRMRDEAEHRLRDERHAFEAESDAAAKQLEEALTIQAQAEQERQAAQEQMTAAIDQERNTARAELERRVAETGEVVRGEAEQQLLASQGQTEELQDELRRVKNENADRERSQGEQIAELKKALEQERLRADAASGAQSDSDEQSLLEIREAITVEFEQRQAEERGQWDEERTSLREEIEAISSELRDTLRKLQKEQTARLADADEARRQMKEAQRLRDEVEQARAALADERRTHDARAEEMRKLAVEEAENMIQEYDATVSKLRADDDAQVRTEREQLQGEIDRLKEALAVVESANGRISDAL